MKVIKNLITYDYILMRRFQRKFKITDYQVAWIAFGKGLLIGALLL